MKWFCRVFVLALVMSAWCSGLAWPTDTLTTDRILLFDDYEDTSVWTHDGLPRPSGKANQWLRDGTIHTNIFGWSFIDCRNGTPINHGREIPPETVDNCQSAMANSTNACFYSPVFTNGIGTIYFDAINCIDAVTVALEITTNMVDLTGCPTNIMLAAETANLVYVWQTVTNIYLDAQSSSWATQPHDFLRYVNHFNYYLPIRLRMRRLDVVVVDSSVTYDSNYATFDNIRISPPPADVVVRKAECVFHPGHPSIGSNMMIRCYVDNIDTNVMTDTRTVHVNYRWRYLDQAVNSWDSLPMDPIDAGDAFGNNQRFEAQIPAQSDVGDLEYYFTCDFDGYRYQSPDYTGLEHVYPSEWLSPRFLRGGTVETDGREFYARLRRHSSPYGVIYVVTEPNNELVEMTLAGDDEWRGMVPVGGQGLTNLTWHFRGENAYVQGEDSFSSGVVHWAQDFQAEAGRLPYGGRCVETNSSGRCSVLVDSTGFVQINLNTHTLDYMARRAEYQNFNDWPAPSDIFSESSGQDPKLRLINTFDGWPTNVTDRKYEYFVGYPSSTNQFWSDPRTTIGGWVAGHSAYVAERTEADVNNSPGGLYDLQNLAMRLKGGDGDLGLGFIYNIVETRTDGLKELSFKCRLGQPFDPNYIVYNFNFMRTNYLVRASVFLDSGNAPERPSVSLIAYYTGPQNFYEYRITQIPQTGTLGADQRQLHELYKWRNGVATRLGAESTRNGWRLSNLTTAEMRLYTTGTSSTRIRCKYGTTDNVLDRTDSSSPHTFGTFGFLSADGQANFSSVQTQPTDANAMPTGAIVTELATSQALFDQQIMSFSVPNGHYIGTRDVSPYGIHTVVPNQNLGVYLHSSSRDSTVQPSAPGTLAWQLYNNITVNSFGYSSYTIPLHQWRADFVMLQVGSGGADVAVDELEVFSWRGQQSSDSGFAGSQDWVANESWVVASQEAGVSEGRLSGSFNTAASGPLTSVQLSTRYADTSDGWVTNSTVLYKGMIYLSGAGSTNMFAERFAGNVRLKIDGDDVLYDTDSVSGATNYIVRASGWYAFELRLGRGVSDAGGPYAGGINGYGVVYSSNNGSSWVQLRDTGSGLFMRANANRVQLDHSRADPDLDQAVRSPVLNTGMGLMEFDYKVVRGPAKLTVQYALKSASGIWHDIESFEVSDPMPDFEHASVYLGSDEKGYLRVLNERDGIYTNSLAEIKNAVVWDEPFVADNSWQVYNAKITETDRQRVILDETKACFLNNSETAEASPIQNLDVPYVKSPRLYKGVGAISFMARAYTNQPASLYVMASTNGWNAPPESWHEIHRFTEISNLLYEPYELELLDGGKYDAVRLVTNIGEQRVCLEDIVVSEPVFPGFEIVGVKTLCKDIDNTYNTRQQPMEAEEFGIEARVANLLLAPSNIQMYVSYYIGTNVWGVENWPAGEVVTKPMYPVEPGSLTYRTLPTNDLPGQERDQVVQYQVWANYLGGVPLTQKQTTFDKPPWYYPVDLNSLYGTQGWSPYAIIYGLPIGAVWINEINITDFVVEGGEQQFGIWDNQYVEIAVPAGFDLAGWRLDFVQNNYTVKTITLPAGLPLQVNATNGYAFFVLADSTATLPKIDYGYPGFSFNYLQTWYPGGIRLRRPMGMYEHTIAYEWDGSYGSYFDGELWAEEEPQKRLVFVGRENNEGSLGVTNGYGQVRDEWHFPGYWTPGAPNESQVVPQAAALLPGFSNVLITATMSSDKATQNGFRNTSLVFKLNQGGDTNITYVVDDWYRLKSLTVNGVEQLPGGGDWPDATYMLSFADVQTNTTVHAQIGLRSEIASLGLLPEVLLWLLGFSDGDLVPSYYYGRELTLTELFWLDADPTVQHTLEGGILSVERDPATNYFLKVQLALDGENCTRLQGDSVFKVEVKNGLTDPNWTMVAQYSFSSNSFDANHQSRIFTSNLWYEVQGVLFTDLFFRWVIEMEDPRFIVWELMNTP